MADNTNIKNAAGSTVAASTEEQTDGSFAPRVAGTKDHDAVDDGSPIKIGGYAKAAAPANVSADADRVNAWFLLNGAQAMVVTAAGALIGGDATNGLDVDVTRIAAGENHLGEVGGKTISKSVTLTTDTAAYASGDLIADTQQIDAFFRKADGTGIINSLTIIDEEAQGVAMYVLFHKTNTSMGSENSAPSIADADASAGIQGIVAIATTDWVTVSGTKVCCIRNIGLPVIAASGTDDLYVSVLNSTGTPDWDADSLVMHIGALLD